MKRHQLVVFCILLLSAWAAVAYEAPRLPGARADRIMSASDPGYCASRQMRAWGCFACVAAIHKGGGTTDQERDAQSRECAVKFLAIQWCGEERLSPVRSPRGVPWSIYDLPEFAGKEPGGVGVEL